MNMFRIVAVILSIALFPVGQVDAKPSDDGPIVIHLEYYPYRAMQVGKVRRGNGHWAVKEVKLLKNAIFKDEVVDKSETELIQALLSGRGVEVHGVVNNSARSLTVTPKFDEAVKVQLKAILGDEEAFFGDLVVGHTPISIRANDCTTDPAAIYYADVPYSQEGLYPSLHYLNRHFGIVVTTTNESCVVDIDAPVTVGDLATLLSAMSDNSPFKMQPDCKFVSGGLEPGSQVQLTQHGLNGCLLNKFSSFGDANDEAPYNRARMIQQVLTAYREYAERGLLEAKPK